MKQDATSVQLLGSRSVPDLVKGTEHRWAVFMPNRTGLRELTPAAAKKIHLLN